MDRFSSVTPPERRTTGYNEVQESEFPKRGLFRSDSLIATDTAEDCS